MIQNWLCCHELLLWQAILNITLKPAVFSQETKWKCTSTTRNSTYRFTCFHFWLTQLHDSEYSLFLLFFLFSSFFLLLFVSFLFLFLFKAYFERAFAFKNIGFESSLTQKRFKATEGNEKCTICVLGHRFSSNRL